MVRIPAEAPTIRDWYVERNTMVAKVCDRLGVGRSTHESSEEPRVVGLAGPRGVGKSTVASMVVARQDVHAFFHMGVLWLQVGQGAKDHLSELMLRLADMVYETVMLKECRAPREAGLDSEPEDGVAYIREVMQDQRNRSFLVVADDVWEVEVLEELERAAVWVLYTSRQHDILPEAPLRVDQVLEEEEGGKSSLDVAWTLHGLGFDADKEERTDEAEFYFRRALAIQEDKLDIHHRDFLANPDFLAKSLHNLGLSISKAGRKEEAEGYFRRALVIREESQGVDHPDVVPTLVGLGKTVAEAGRLEEAEGYFQRALSIQEEKLGIDHPDVADTLLNLGARAGMAGKETDAKQYYQRALAVQEKHLDVNHPDMATTLRNLGISARYARRTRKAEDYFRRALAIWEHQLGVDHPCIASTLFDLGACAGSAGKIYEAKKYYQRALVIQEKSLGVDHPDASETRNALLRLTRMRRQRGRR